MKPEELIIQHHHPGNMALGFPAPKKDHLEHESIWRFTFLVKKGTKYHNSFLISHH